ncbi:MAG: flippase-like domain-containing protein [Bacteroidales bacterium]|nr:flippase-like domain-containing protein [Bacteroidales bacterium]
MITAIKTFLKKKKVYILILKTLFFAGAWYFLIKKLIKTDITILDKINNNIFESSLIVTTTILLLFVNWGLESYKWKLLISSVENISFIKAVRIIFIGLSFALITPNRIGEIFARTAYLETKNKPRILALTTWGSISQLIVTCIVGIPCVTYIFISKN